MRISLQNRSGRNTKLSKQDIDKFEALIVEAQCGGGLLICNDMVKLAEALPKHVKHVKLEDVEIWFQDETHVGQQGSLSRVWHYCGQRPHVVRQQQFL